MPKICAARTAVPPHQVSQQTAREFARRIFSQKIADADRLLGVFCNSGIETRYFSKPLEWLLEPRDLAEKNQAYIEGATELSAKASRDLFETTGVTAGQIDYIIYINTTGLATPSIDARLINILKLRTNVRRTPIWGLGCAGGVAGLSHAYHYALGHPKDRVLVIATELCGLTFMRDDFSKSNLVASALFGEGAAAVLITGDEVDMPGLEIVDTQSRFYPDSLDVMGWSVESKGLQVVFARRIPDIVAANAASDIDGFLGQHNLTRANLSAYLFHPGGMKVIEAYEQALGFCDSELGLARETLREYGNMSSVTVLFVLERYLRKYGLGRDGYGLLSALGPGFCSESMLVRL
jgi:alkylresorcinol/alkylpyrone synthase